MENIFELLKQRDQITIGLNRLHFGSVEKRNVGGKQYVYVHQRIGGSQKTQYVGEATDEVFKSIDHDNRVASSLKKRLKDIDKRLRMLGYEKGSIHENTEICISLASRYLSEYIYNQAAIEGLPTTFADTESLIYDGDACGLTLMEIETIIGLKNGWRFIMSEGGMSSPSSLELFSTINAIVEREGQGAAGSVRTIPVKINNTRYYPPIPIEEEVRDEISAIINKEPSIDVGIDLALYLIKKQIFRDGNKRTASLSANHYLMKEGFGLLNIPKEKDREFFSLLKGYYENNAENDIRLFLKKNCFVDVGRLIEESEKERRKKEEEFRNKNAAN